MKFPDIMNEKKNLLRSRGKSRGNAGKRGKTFQHCPI